MLPFTVNQYGKILKNIRLAHNLTHYQFSELTSCGNSNDIAQSSLSAWENGKRTPSTDALARIAFFYAVSIDYITGGSNNPHPNDYLKRLEQDRTWNDMPESFQKILPTDYIAFVDSKELHSNKYSNLVRADIIFLINVIFGMWCRIVDDFIINVLEDDPETQKTYFDKLFIRVIEGNGFTNLYKTINLLKDIFENPVPKFSKDSY